MATDSLTSRSRSFGSFLSLTELERRDTPAQLLWVGEEWELWSDSDNWWNMDTSTLGGVPGPSDDVFIDGGVKNTSSITDDVNVIRSLTVFNFTRTVLVLDSTLTTDFHLTVLRYADLQFGANYPSQGLGEGDGRLLGSGVIDPRPNGGDLWVVGEGGVALEWSRGIFEDLDLRVGYPYDPYPQPIPVSEIAHMYGALGYNRLSLLDSAIYNEAYSDMRVHDAVMNVYGTSIQNAGLWNLDGDLHAKYAADNTFVNHHIFDVDDSINYWYFDVTNYSRAFIGDRIGATAYPASLIVTAYQQDTPGRVRGVQLTNIRQGSSVYVGELGSETMSINSGRLYSAGDIHGSVYIAGSSPQQPDPAEYFSLDFGVTLGGQSDEKPGTSQIFGDFILDGEMDVWVEELNPGVFVMSQLIVDGTSYISDSVLTVNLLTNFTSGPALGFSGSFLITEGLVGGWSTLDTPSWPDPSTPLYTRTFDWSFTSNGNGGGVFSLFVV